MMDLTDWKAGLPAEWKVYAIIDPLADNKPLQYWYLRAESTDAWPLYAGTEFADDILNGPWLLLLNQLPDWEAWWQEQEAAGQATGLLLASATEPEKLVRHWQSLLTAGLDGEEVLFRYYDPRILASMLYTFTQEETRRFLGPTNELLLWHHDDWLIASPYPEPDLTEHSEPWWRMQELHFSGQPGQKELLINSLDDWLWQNNPELMMQWLQTHDDVRQQLSVHYDAVSVPPVPSIWLPSVLTFRLFNYHHEWQEFQRIIRLDQNDEQTDILQKTIAFIEKEQQLEVRGHHG